MPGKETYLTAMEFRKTKLWTVLYDDELFAVALPGGEIGYASVLGMEGKMFALILYPGRAGLDTYRRLNLAPPGEDALAERERLICQDAMLCSFEVKAGLDEDDLREVAEYGLRVRGAGSNYPCFRRVRPGRIPWTLEDPADEANLVLALRAGIEVARRIAETGGKHARDYDDAAEQLGFLSEAPFDRDVPLLTPNAGGGFDWDMTPLPAMAPVAWETPVYGDEVAIKRLANAKKRGAWEFEAFQSPNPVLEAGDPAPFLPLMCFIVRHSDGIILRIGSAKSPETGGTDLLAALIACAEEHGAPATIYVRDARSCAIAEDLASRTGIRLSTAAKSTFLPEVRADFIAHMDENSADRIAAALDEIERMNPDELTDEMLEMLAYVADSGEVSDGLRARIVRILGKKGD